MKLINTFFIQYFILNLLSLVLEFLVWLNINETLTAILNFINILLKFPQSMFDLVVMNDIAFGNLVLFISAIFFFYHLYNNFF